MSTVKQQEQVSGVPVEHGIHLEASTVGMFVLEFLALEAVRNSRPSISTFFPGWPGPRHVMHLSAMLYHLLGLHIHKIAAGPPAHEYGLEVHPHMIVDSPVVRACIGTEGAVGVIGLDHGGNSIYDVGFSGGNLSHGHRAYYVMQPNVLPIDGVKEISREGLPVVPEGLEVLVMLELSVFGPDHFLHLSFPLL